MFPSLEKNDGIAVGINQQCFAPKPGLVDGWMLKCDAFLQECLICGIQVGDFEVNDGIGNAGHPIHPMQGKGRIAFRTFKSCIAVVGMNDQPKAKRLVEVY